MQFSSFFTLLACAVSLVAAEAGYGTDSTTTLTSTMTQTVTITKCNPTNTNCPAYSTTSTSESTTSTTSSWYPLSNSTSSRGPTAYANSTIVYTTKSVPPVTQTSVVLATPTTAKPSASASTVISSSARGLFVQSGLLLAVLGAGVALLT